MKTTKKSGVGLVRVSTPLSGVNRKRDNDLSVKIVVFFLPQKTKR